MGLAAKPNGGSVGSVRRRILTRIDLVCRASGDKNVVIGDRSGIEVAFECFADGDRVRSAVRDLRDLELRVVAKHPAAILTAAFTKDALIAQVIRGGPIRAHLSHGIARANECRDQSFSRRDQLWIDVGIYGGVQIFRLDQVGNVFLFDIREAQREPTQLVTERWTIDSAFDVSWREIAVRVVIHLQREAELFDVVKALAPPGSFAGRLNRGQQECHQNADDRNHDQQFD